MERNGKSIVGIPWEWELVKKIGNGNGKKWELTRWEWEGMGMQKVILGHL